MKDMRMGIIEKFWRLEYPYSHYREWYYEFNKYTIIRWFVISEIMNSLFTTLMLLGSVTVNASNSTIVSEENYCYDQVGDYHYCYESIEESAFECKGR